MKCVPNAGEGNRPRTKTALNMHTMPVPDHVENTTLQVRLDNNHIHAGAGSLRVANGGKGETLDRTNNRFECEIYPRM